MGRGQQSSCLEPPPFPGAGASPGEGRAVLRPLAVEGRGGAPWGFLGETPALPSPPGPSWEPEGNVPLRQP